MMTQASNKAGERSAPWLSALERVAFLVFAFYLILLLGANSVARSGGPLSWLPLWRWPAADNQWTGIGVAGLLPLLSVAAWLTARAARGTLGAITWRWNAVSLPLLALVVLVALNLGRQCATGCDLASLLRLALLVAHLAWIYLYVVNERPPLLGIVLAVIAIQGVVALGQFLTQRDLGLGFLGELPLDPAVAGISVIMRGPERWLRAYGLTIHPNVLATTLVPLLLILPTLDVSAPHWRRLLALAGLALGFVTLFTTLARWANLCFGLGLALNAAALIGARRHGKARPSALIDGRALGLLALLAGLLVAVYGDAVAGRAVGLETPVENRSIWERERDTAISLRLIAEQPLTGIGWGRYSTAAQALDRWAVPVHNLPLLLAAELGLAGLAAWALIVIAPLARRGAFTDFAPHTALWLSFWLLGLFYLMPHPLYELRSALLTGLVAGVVSLSITPRQRH